MSLRNDIVFKYSRFLSDKTWIMIKYFQFLGCFPNLKNPTTFNEKLQWLKLNDRKPIYSVMVDKYEVRRIIEKEIGKEYLIPLIGGPWANFDEINFDMLPDKFVLKTTHDSGGVILCNDKAKLNKEIVKKKIDKHLSRNYFYQGREWPYKDAKKRIIAEELVKDRNYEYLPVYKFFCFNGDPKIIQTIQNDKQKDETIDYFDISWNKLELKQNFPNSEKSIQKPVKLDEMIEIAKKLSKGMSFIRVDLYLINDDVKFSEFTFYSDCGLAKFEPKEWDKILGDYIDLNIK